jgi:L-malate glycosyltransferase
LKNQLKALAIELGLENKVLFYGHANKDEIAELLYNSDLLVLSSKYETFGVVIIEAFSAGIPVVSTACGGPESIIIDKRLGEICSIDEESMSNSIQKVLMQNYDSDFIRNFAAKHFSAQALKHNLLKIYNNIVK